MLDGVQGMEQKQIAVKWFRIEEAVALCNNAIGRPLVYLYNLNDSQSTRIEIIYRLKDTFDVNK